ncbi:response regulator, partial [Thioclava sp. BHET1]
DDVATNRHILERQLTPAGYGVVLCASASEALAALSSGVVCDMVVTDHLMPGGSGLDLTRRLREAGYDMPVVIFSSSPGEIAADDPVFSELSAVLQKPVLRRDLLRRLAGLAAPEQQVAATPKKPTVPALPSPEVRRMRILVAEDNRTNQLVFRKMVKHLELELTFAVNGREAVELFERDRPDLIFMDISMPEIDGKAAARAIRRIEAEIETVPVPIVALTAHAMQGDDAAVLAAGIDRYLTKPLRRAAIVDQITFFCPKDAHPPMPSAAAE